MLALSSCCLFRPCCFVSVFDSTAPGFLAGGTAPAGGPGISKFPALLLVASRLISRLMMILLLSALLEGVSVLSEPDKFPP